MQILVSFNIVNLFIVVIHNGYSDTKAFQVVCSNFKGNSGIGWNQQKFGVQEKKRGAVKFIERSDEPELMRYDSID
jgi:hypothetical protein